MAILASLLEVHTSRSRVVQGPLPESPEREKAFPPGTGAKGRAFPGRKRSRPGGERSRPVLPERSRKERDCPGMTGTTPVSERRSPGSTGSSTKWKRTVPARSGLPRGPYPLSRDVPPLGREVRGHAVTLILSASCHRVDSLEIRAFGADPDERQLVKNLVGRVKVHQ